MVLWWAFGRIFGSNVRAKMIFLIKLKTQLQIQPSMTRMAQMILSKPLVIIVCMYQELISWLSLNRILNGVAV
jgi:hypothetical protein